MVFYLTSVPLFCYTVKVAAVQAGAITINNNTNHTEQCKLYNDEVFLECWEWHHYN